MSWENPIGMENILGKYTWLGNIFGQSIFGSIGSKAFLFGGV